MKQKSQQGPARSKGLRSIALFVAGLFALSVQGFGQSPDLPASLTSGLKPPSKARWSITYHFLEKPPVPTEEGGDDKTPEAEALPIRADYQLDGALGRAAVAYKGGAEKVVYLVDGLTVSRDKATERIKTAVFGPYTGADGWFGKYYPGFSWIDQKAFVGVEEINGKKCYHFKYKFEPKAGGDSSDGLAFDPANPRSDCEAWVDVQSKRPFLFRQGNLVGQYQFEQEPGGSIILPAEFQKALRVYYGYSD